MNVQKIAPTGKSELLFVRDVKEKAKPTVSDKVYVSPQGFIMESNVIDYTPQLADDYLTNCPFDWQRNFDQSRANRYKVAIKSNNFRPNSQIQVAVLGNRRMAIDGYHRSWAVRESGISITVNLLTIVVNTMEEAQWLYFGTDIGKGRNLGDALTAAGMIQKTGLTIPQQRAVSAALPLIYTGFESGYYTGNASPSFDFRIKNILDWKDEAKSYFDCFDRLTGNYVKMFWRPPVVAVGLTTFRYKPEKAKEFWGSAYNGSGLEYLDPRSALVRFLVNNKTGLKASYSEYAKRVSSAWNGFYRKETRKTLQAPFGDNAITIEGTPYSTKRVLRMEVQE